MASAKYQELLKVVGNALALDKGLYRLGEHSSHEIIVEAESLTGRVYDRKTYGTCKADVDKLARNVKAIAMGNGLTVTFGSGQPVSTKTLDSSLQLDEDGTHENRFIRSTTRKHLFVVDGYASEERYLLEHIDGLSPSNFSSVEQTIRLSGDDKAELVFEFLDVIYERYNALLGRRLERKDMPKSAILLGLVEPAVYLKAAKLATDHYEKKKEELENKMRDSPIASWPIIGKKARARRIDGKYGKTAEKLGDIERAFLKL